MLSAVSASGAVSIENAAPAIRQRDGFTHSYRPGYIELMAYNFAAIEKKWQQLWQEKGVFRAKEPSQAGSMPKSYVLDMFPYPSGDGLHVGHVIQQTATDIICRYLRMKGHNVLHPMGWDAFGLPAEQYAIKTNQHPAITTRNNIDRFRSQIQSLGMSYDWEREVDTTDPKYYRWTQWIFLQLFNSYFDPIDQKAKPIGHLVNELQNGNLVVAPDGSIHLNPTQEGMEAISGEMRIERLWHELSESEQRDVLAGQRLAYMDDIAVNWCPALGTVLANEEVIDGKSEVGGFPVVKQPMRQWMLRITAYCERLLNDLDKLDWPESLKEMQRNWIGKSVGAEIDFDIDGNEEDEITVFTTRPDTLYGATYMVLSPEHPLVDTVTTEEQRPAVESYRQSIAGKSERDRMADTKDKTGVFTGAYAINPINDEKLPIWIADYVLMGYGTGAIMAVPAHDERDFEFAVKFDIPIRAVVTPNTSWLQSAAAEFWRKAQPQIMKDGKPATLEDFPESARAATQEWIASEQKRMAELAQHADGKVLEDTRAVFIQNPKMFGHAYPGEGIAINSSVIDGLPTAQAKEQMIEVLRAEGVGRRKVNYKLRDWLFSRQRYWGEPFPIILDAEGNAWAADEEELPITLPEMADFKPTGTPEPPLSKARDWVNQTIDGKPAARETNTMPQWAGSCWYYLRYIDPKNPGRFVDPEKERYWMPVDLYVGGVEHAVLHLLYSRFWHKVLFDLGHVSTSEPFQRLVNQGLILGETEFHVFERQGKPVSVVELRDIEEEATETKPQMIAFHRTSSEKLIGRRVAESEVEKTSEGYVLKSDPKILVDARSFKMSKSRGNVVNPDAIVRDYGADTFRLYEMYMGPLEAQKPWNTRDIIGMARFLNAVYRHFIGDEEAGKLATISEDPIPEALDRQMHRTIKKVGEDIENLRFNTAIAELIKLNSELGKLPSLPRQIAEPFALMLAPFAPHLAEELWSQLGHGESLACHSWPSYQASKLVDSTMELPVQINGKLRGTISVAADADKASILQTAREAPFAKPWLEGKTIAKELYVEKKLVNFVVK